MSPQVEDSASNLYPDGRDHQAYVNPASEATKGTPQSIMHGTKQGAEIEKLEFSGHIGSGDFNTRQWDWSVSGRE